jgi:hypothetical protein
MTILSIDIMTLIWLGFPIHKELEKHRGTPILKEHCTHTNFHAMHTPPLDEVIEFHNLKHAFPRVPQKFFPNEK